MIAPRRGQTTLDFAIGMGVFLLTVVFVVAYAPTLFDPFAGGTGTKLIVADRAATTLSGDLLAASTADPGTLSAGCVAAFFGESVDGGSCDAGVDFDDGDALDTALSLDGRNANVTVHDLDAPASRPATPAWAEEPLSRSTVDAVPSDVAVATRTVSIDERWYRLTVRVW
jgi:hypothetical protein